MPPKSSGAKSKEEEDEELDGDHGWNFRYNRRLSCFSNAVSCITFSMDGRYLVSGTGSGDVKVWDTSTWAEAAKLTKERRRREEPKALVISPAQRWLVAAYGSQLHIYQFSPPWQLQASMAPKVDPLTKDAAEWSCVAFAPMSEVDHPGGHTGQDNHLAAFSTASLCVLDYSGGWGPETPKRTRSTMQSARPTSLAYTACGGWILCGFESGQLQIWNAFSLTMEKTLSAHTDVVNSVTASPPSAPYDPRFITCSKDQTLRVWHSCGWQLEQHVHDMYCDRAGVRRCTFSCSGSWLVSVADALSVWRVCITKKDRMVLQLHQRLDAACGAEGLLTAAFCAHSDAIAVGSRDGVLGIWTKHAGVPAAPADASAGNASLKTATANSDQSSSQPLLTTALPRPMQRITPQGVKPLLAQPSSGQSRGDWFQKLHLRSIKMSPLGGRSGLSATTSAARLSLTPTSQPQSPSKESPSNMTRSSSTPDFQWKASTFDAADILSQFGSKNAKYITGAAPKEDLPTMQPWVSPVRKNMQHACRNLVQRISLEPKVVTDEK